MIKKFCLVGVDGDFEDFIKKYRKFYLGYFSSKKGRKYKSVSKKIGSENLSSWLPLKEKYNPNVFITIDNGKEKESLIKKIYKNNSSNLIFKEAFIEKSTLKNIKKRKGIIIQKFSKISSNVNINDGVKIHINCQIHHDTKIDKYVTIAPACVILGNVKIGKYSYIGANTTIKHNIKIGNNCIIVAGSTVISDVNNTQRVAGRPAKKIR
jgi:serine acetyltransferase